MSSHAVTLTLPDLLFEPVQRIAQATKQPLEAVLLTALQASLPPLEGLPADVARELAELEALDDAALWNVMLEKARAAVLLRFRGRRVPTLAEMRRETPPAR